MSSSRSAFRISLAGLILSLLCVNLGVCDASAIDVIKLSEKWKVLNGFRSSRRVAKAIAFVTFARSGSTATSGLCTGIVIGRDQILTCAHCFYDSSGPDVSGRDYYVYVGGRKEYHGPAYKVKRIAAYQGYDNNVWEKDFAILTTEEKFAKGTIRRAIIPSEELPPNGKVMQTAGFGAVVFDGVGDPDDDGKLMQVTLRFHRRGACRRLDPGSRSFTAGNEYICAIHPLFPGGGGGACYGDSGGPLFSEGEDERMVVHGLVAAGDWDCIGDMGYFPNVHKYSGAIRNYMGGNDEEWDIIRG